MVPTAAVCTTYGSLISNFLVGRRICALNLAVSLRNGLAHRSLVISLLGKLLSLDTQND